MKQPRKIVLLTKPNVIWGRLTNFSKLTDELDDLPVQASFLGKVFHYSIGRNAYWGAWSSSYPGDLSFEIEESILKERIERERKQGTTFTFKELPALVLRTKSCDLLLFQTWGNEPFRKIPKDAIAGKMALEIAQSICKHEDWINAFIAPHRKANPATLPFEVFQSEPREYGVPLGWCSRLGNRYELGSIMELVADVTIHLNDQG